MKKRFYNPAVLAVLLLVIYFLGLLLGLFSVVVYPVRHRQKKAMFSRAESIAEEYTKGTSDTIEYIKSPTVRILIYGADGSCQQHVALRHLHKTAIDDAVIHAYLSPYLSKVLNGQGIFDLAKSYEEPRKLTNFCLIVGTPIMEGETVTGAVFLIKFLENLQEAYIGYMVYFSVFYWITIYCIITFNRKKRKLEEAQRTYIANVTHALKSPIASVKAITETLSDVPDLDPDKRTLYYGMILRETNMQSHMVQEILELSKLQNHGIDFTKTSVSASQVFEKSFEKFLTLCDCAHISFHVADKLSQLPCLYTNAACIRQVMEILLENAVKYVSSGNNIWISADSAKNYVVFSVRDDGCGISEEDLPHVFERFYRCSRNAKNSSGLGLAIAKEIMDNLNERIWIESKLGQGTVIYFTIHTK